MTTDSSAYQPPAGDSRWITLGRVLRARREALGLSQHALSARGGPSSATVRYAENGQAGPYRAITILAFEKALGWQEGSFLTALHGGTPTVIPDGSGDHRTRDADRCDDAVEDDTWATLLDRVNTLIEVADDLQARAATDPGGARPRLVTIPDDAWDVLADVAHSHDITIAAAAALCIRAYAQAPGDLSDVTGS